MEKGLERQITNNAGEVICSCRGSIAEVTSCLRASVDTLRSLRYDRGFTMEVPNNPMRRDHQFVEMVAPGQNILLLLERQAHCVREGLAALGEKAE